MDNRNRYIFPTFFILSYLALALKKYMVPFHGFFLIVIFDGLAVLFFLRAFTSEKLNEVPHGRSFNFDIGSLVYAICCIAVLYRLQYWNGWERWVYLAGILFLVLSVITIYSIFLFLKLPGRPGRMKLLLRGHLSWIYFLTLVPVTLLANPRTFHTIFNGTTYEEYVRTRYPAAEGTLLLEKYKPTAASVIKCSDELLEFAFQSEKKGEYKDALAYYNKSIDFNPDNAIAIYNRGRLKLTKLDIDKEMALDAIADFTRAIQLDSMLAAAYYHRAVAQNYLHMRSRLPAHNDLLKAAFLDTNLRHDKFINNFLALPLIDSTVDTTTYIHLDDE